MPGERRWPLAAPGVASNRCRRRHRPTPGCPVDGIAVSSGSAHGHCGSALVWSRNTSPAVHHACRTHTFVLMVPKLSLRLGAGGTSLAVPRRDFFFTTEGIQQMRKACRLQNKSMNGFPARRRSESRAPCGRRQLSAGGGAPPPKHHTPTCQPHTPRTTGLSDGSIEEVADQGLGHELRVTSHLSHAGEQLQACRTCSRKPRVRGRPQPTR